MTTNDQKRLLLNPGIIRNRLKISAFIENAQAYLRLRESGTCLESFLWSKVNHQAIVNSWPSMKAMPSKTSLSDQISKELKSKGFKFVGSITIYAYLQAIGIVNDHLDHCWKSSKPKRAEKTQPFLFLPNNLSSKPYSARKERKPDLK